ncbi:putative major antigen [Operophtera brumata]|uniref:Putative major antigen n=1 Tax=Operophtera brumata TaxID=104452 RepID=A0A0L7LHR6_OPEBR|nr:putative major antigen [Operophtera brumata]
METETQSEDEEPSPPKDMPPYGTIEWIYYWSELEGHLPTPIDVSITGSIAYWCPELKSEYLTQAEALRHDDGVVVICYIIKYGVNPDDRLSWVIEGFPRVNEAQTSTRVGPYPMCRLLPMFFEDYFLYWGSMVNTRHESRTIKEFRKLGDPWDEPNLRNFRPLQEREDRHVLFISPHWNQYNSLLPIPRVPEPSISVLSPAYEANLWMLPPQNAYMLPEEEEEDKPEKE